MSSTPSAAELVAAVDVGTGSARAGIFDAKGRLLGRAEAPIATYPGDHGHAEQSSAEIWAACGSALRAARAEAAAAPAAIAGLAFDATCSLALRDAAGQPLTVSTGGDDRRDVLLWLDHRAAAEAAECTATGHPLVRYAGGALSPEMQLPKLVWLKRHLPGSWARMAGAFDLVDLLGWLATGNPARSQCSLACKWGWLPHRRPGWAPDFLAEVGLADLLDRAGLVDGAAPIGSDLGALTPAAAAALGLAPGTRVAAGLIDAHAGALGLLGHLAGEPAALRRQIALIAGTSSSLMAFAPEPRFTPGIWGPYPDVALPGLWMREGGQSAAGALLDHVVRGFGGLDACRATHARIVARIAALRGPDPDLAPRLHVLPDFHGNRSPLADPTALGVISGLPLDASFDALCRLYWRTAVAIALGLRAIIEHLNAHGHAVDTLHVTGGHVRNPLLMELYADATLCRTIEPGAPDAVLLGTAMIAATGAGLHPSLAAAGAAMHQPGRPRAPDPRRAAQYARDWRAFQTLHRHRTEIETTVDRAPG